jgi:hypothetical protein
MGTRPGPVKERIAAFQSGFTQLIRGFVVKAIEQKELPASEDPEALTFEINGLVLAANSSFVLQDDPKASEMPRRVLRQRIGLPAERTPVRRKRAVKRS